MARKSRKQAGAGDSADPQQAVRDSAQKIWLAGLGAFERAKSEGPRMFETLVEQGRAMGAKAVGAADDALSKMRQASYGGGQWDKLEQVFEDRVSKSLQRLGVLTSREVESLSKQVEELNATVRNMMAKGEGKAARAAAKKPRRKKAASAAKKPRAKKATRA